MHPRFKQARPPALQLLFCISGDLTKGTIRINDLRIGIGNQNPLIGVIENLGVDIQLIQVSLLC